VGGASREVNAELARQYERRFAAQADYRDRVWRVLVDVVFQRYVPESGAVLELGCGWGEFINHVRASRRAGMDLNPESRARLQSGVEFLHQDCSAEWPVADGSLDVIFTSNFFEHLPDKASLARTLRQALRCLKPGGRLICLGPNIRYLHGAYWDFWDHYVPLTEKSLVEVLELTGFTIERALPRFLPYTMSRERNPPLWTLRLYLRLPFVWPLFGKQFLVVGRKP
jgi:SAM-dependent methyltransferase